MNDLLNKLSSYNIFNYLFPGVLFAAIGDELTSYSLIYEEIIIGVFVYYFYGLVISRIGSLVLEPLLKWISVIKFSPYKDFVAASKVDEKLELLSEINNMYRTLAALFLCLLLLKSSEVLTQYFSVASDGYLILSIFILVVLFVFSYRKQSNYITQRITKTLKLESKNGSDVGDGK